MPLRAQTWAAAALEQPGAFLSGGSGSGSEDNLLRCVEASEERGIEFGLRTIGGAAAAADRSANGEAPAAAATGGPREAPVAGSADGKAEATEVVEVVRVRNVRPSNVLLVNVRALPRYRHCLRLRDAAGIAVHDPAQALRQRFAREAAGGGGTGAQGACRAVLLLPGAEYSFEVVLDLHPVP
ncbi:hypothetical protein GPECTOR_62g919 [Gonium pectorale]|uniref:Uncharacterized protein n=1 Tax=Gonium pectorale TaxID=33097 RepID=A0A150G4Q2_GONPE|nr:hypothetical protein GPECTOR_62g919 [Gonium pectorale]|eukprot:KXZ44804.1 hypothetical protein GPECTOR_62g919 [Gonium pectorale]